MQCAHCKGAATLACSSCKSSPALDGDAGIAHYCNALCQKSDWVNHKRTCRRLQDRTSLFRVAMTSQQLYYMFRELTWAQFELSGVEKSGENLILRGELKRSVKLLRDYRHFPDHFFATTEDRKAALNFLQCRDAALWVIGFLHGMLGGIVKHITTLEVRTKNPKLPTWILLPHVPVPLKFRKPLQEILKVMTASEAPQSRGLIDIADYSLQKMVLSQLKLREQDIEVPGRLRMNPVLELMIISMLRWQFEEKLSLDTLCKLHPGKFDKRQNDLVNYIELVFHRRPDVQYSTTNGRRLAKEVPGKWVFGK